MAEWLPLIERFGFPLVALIIVIAAFIKGWIYTRGYVQELKVEIVFWKTRSKEYEDALTKALRKRFQQ